MCLSLGYRYNIDELTAVAAFSETYCAVDKCIECVVFAHTYVEARMVYGAALTFDDVTGFCKLAAENLDAKTFAF